MANAGNFITPHLGDFLLSKNDVDGICLYPRKQDRSSPSVRFKEHRGQRVEGKARRTKLFFVRSPLALPVRCHGYPAL